MARDDARPAARGGAFSDFLQHCRIEIAVLEAFLRLEREIGAAPQRRVAGRRVTRFALVLAVRVRLQAPCCALARLNLICCFRPGEGRRTRQSCDDTND